MFKKTKKKSIIKKILKILGPGLITGASDDDPSGIATYSQAGAQFGLATLWVAIITFPLMATIQETCARIGMVTSLGLTGTLKKHYSKPILYLMVIFSFPAIILNIGADIASMGAVSNLLFPNIRPIYFSAIFTFILLICMIYLPYQKLSAILKYLCLTLFVYLIIPFLSHLDMLDIIKHTFIPTIYFSRDYLKMFVALLGTTISPYLFFWQATMEVEDMKKTNLLVDRHLIKKMKFDVNFGMLFSNVIMYFIILSTGTVLFNNNIHQIQTVEQAAMAFAPLAGKFSYILFAMGIIGTGFLAIPVLCGTLSYIISETFGWEEGLDKKFHEAKSFYVVIGISLIVGLLLNYVGIGPIQALIYSAVLYGITAPVLIAIIIHIANNKKIMGEYTNSKKSNILGIITFLIMTISSFVLVIYSL